MKTIVLLLITGIAISSVTEAAPLSVEFRTWIDSVGISRADSLHNLKAYHNALGNIHVLLKQRGEIRRLDCIRQVERIKRTIQEDLGWITYIPQGLSPSLDRLNLTLGKLQRTAEQPAGKNEQDRRHYDQNLISQVNSLQSALASLAKNLKNGSANR